jgi:hypothetical protein
MWYEYVNAAIAFDWAITLTDENIYNKRCEKLSKLIEQIACLYDVYNLDRKLLNKLLIKKAKEIEAGGSGKINLKLKGVRYSDSVKVETDGNEEEFLIGEAIVATGCIKGPGAPIHPDIVKRGGEIYEKLFESSVC